MSSKTMSAKTKLLSCIVTLFVFAIMLITIISYLNFKSTSVSNNTHMLQTESFLISNALDQKIQRYFDG